MTKVSPPFHDALLEIVPQLRAYARALCGGSDLADDLVQETLLKAWEKKNDVRDKSCLKSWAMTIMRNEFRGHWRRRKFVVEDEGGYWADTLTVEPEQPAHVDLQDLVSALRDIADVHREAIVLIFVNELSYKEASKVAGCPVGTMKSRVNRARQELAARLGLIDDVIEENECSDAKLPASLESIFQTNLVDKALCSELESAL